MAAQSAALPPPTTTTSFMLAEDKRQQDEPQRDAVGDERRQGVALEVVHEEPNGDPAGREGRQQRDRERPALARRDSELQQVERLERAGARGDRDAEQERETRGRRTVDR